MPRKSIGGPYPPNWKEIAQKVKDEAGWCCIRCGVAHDPPRHVLTVHHLDMHPEHSNPETYWWNLLPLCARCHLSVQGRVILERPWIFDHSDWFKPYVAAYYAWRYLGEELDRTAAAARLDELLRLECEAMGVPV